MNTDEIKAIIRRIVKEFLTEARMDVADELFSQNFVNHSPGYPSPENEV